MLPEYFLLHLHLKLRFSPSFWTMFPEEILNFMRTSSNEGAIPLHSWEFSFRLVLKRRGCSSRNRLFFYSNKSVYYWKKAIDFGLWFQRETNSPKIASNILETRLWLRPPWIWFSRFSATLDIPRLEALCSNESETKKWNKKANEGAESGDEGWKRLKNSVWSPITDSLVWCTQPRPSEVVYLYK